MMMNDELKMMRRWKKAEREWREKMQRVCTEGFFTAGRKERSSRERRERTTKREREAGTETREREKKKGKIIIV